ncbi:MAG TPA: 4-alpha-glucanotransferase [Gemmatimonadaceae bacterium]|nr:4-alpha-glucanotransferase [Gemmatimonadaceae bacterium]
MARRKRSGRRSSGPLRALADRVGIIDEYVDQTGKERRVTSDRTRAALLATLGYEVSDEDGARDALDSLRERERERILPPVRVTTDAASMTLRLPRGWPTRVEWAVELESDKGSTKHAGGRSTKRTGGALEIALDEPPELGYHTLRLTVTGKGQRGHAEQRLIVVPDKCTAPAKLLGGRRVIGLTANAYTLRSARNWGVGDTADLARLIEWAADIGAAFVGVNPLHALRNRGHDISPYGPVSRLFGNVLYLDIEAIPEMTVSAEARTLTAGALPRIAELRAARRVDYEAVMGMKRPVLEALYRSFAEQHRGRQTERGRAFKNYIGSQGRELEDFATWCALDERQQGKAWQSWPVELRDPRSPAVQAFREKEGERVGFHQWMQFELDRQLGETQARARELSLPIGLYQDLAIGAAADGSDTWMQPGLFLEGASIGAPPDPYAAAGQNWGLPAINPHRLAEDGYSYWIRLVRAALRHAGALRIDHVLGLFRQFWIPRGMQGSDGAYVKFPGDDLLGIAALESVRANALIVGEDLGTVPPEVPPALERWGVLSSKVMYFETEPARARFKPPRSYPPLALTTANTHDMPSIAAFWRERDIDLRAEVGAIPTQRAVRAARKERADAREALANTLVDEGLWPTADEPTTDLALREAVHALLRRTPSWLVGLSLDDLTGEIEPVNLPGVSPDRWPSWTRRMTMSLEEIGESPDVRRALGVERQWNPGR